MKVEVTVAAAAELVLDRVPDVSRSAAIDIVRRFAPEVRAGPDHPMNAVVDMGPLLEWLEEHYPVPPVDVVADVPETSVTTPAADVRAQQPMKETSVTTPVADAPAQPMALPTTKEELFDRWKTLPEGTSYAEAGRLLAGMPGETRLPDTIARSIGRWLGKKPSSKRVRLARNPLDNKDN